MWWLIELDKDKRLSDYFTSSIYIVKLGHKIGDDIAPYRHFLTPAAHTRWWWWWWWQISYIFILKFVCFFFLFYFSHLVSNPCIIQCTQKLGQSCHLLCVRTHVVHHIYTLTHMRYLNRSLTLRYLVENFVKHAFTSNRILSRGAFL